MGKSRKEYMRDYMAKKRNGANTDVNNQADPVNNHVNNVNTTPKDCAGEAIPAKPDTKYTPNRALTQAMMDGLPFGVSRPSAPLTVATASHTAADLYRDIRQAGIHWMHCPAYTELIYRLITIKPADLEAQGYNVPVWRRAQAS